jgi:hypothetical protein
VKRNEIILDLYFFRPPAAERPDKEGDGITLNIKKTIQPKKLLYMKLIRVIAIYIIIGHQNVQRI